MAEKEKKPPEKGIPLLFWGNLEKKKNIQTSREQLVMNGIFGCVFFLAGIFLVAPNAVGYGGQGIFVTALWLIGSGAVAGVEFYHAAHWQPAPMEEEPQPEEPQEETLEEKLKRLQSLYEQQLITEEEYQSKKKELLGEL